MKSQTRMIVLCVTAVCVVAGGYSLKDWFGASRGNTKVGTDAVLQSSSTSKLTDASTISYPKQNPVAPSAAGLSSPVTSAVQIDDRRSNQFLTALRTTKSLWASMESYAESNDSRAVNVAARILAHCLLFDWKMPFEEWYSINTVGATELGFDQNSSTDIDRIRREVLRIEHARCSAVNNAERRAGARLGDAYFKGMGSTIAALRKDLKNGVAPADALRKHNLVPLSDNALTGVIAEIVARHSSFPDAKSETDQVLLDWFTHLDLACSLGDDCAVGSLTNARACLEISICGEGDPVAALLVELVRRGYNADALRRVPLELRRLFQ
jgi:hypothetical protein